MKANDVVVFEGGAGEPYEIGKLKIADGEPKPTYQVDSVHHEQNRETAFAKARSVAAGRDVFFTQYGRPGYQQNFYNYIRCPKCGILVEKFTDKTFATAPSVPLRSCPACTQMIDAPAILSK